MATRPIQATTKNGSETFSIALEYILTYIENVHIFGNPQVPKESFGENLDEFGHYIALLDQQNWNLVFDSHIKIDQK